MSFISNRRILRSQLLDQDAIEPPAPDTQGAEMALRLLLPRARRVYEPSIAPWPENTEDLVHDVRVASRRLVEALSLLKPILPARRVKKVERRLKMLRRALGESREADVMVADFRRLATQAGWQDDVIHALDAMAETGRTAMAKVAYDYPPERLLRHGLDLLELGFQATTRSLRDIASRHLMMRIASAEHDLPTLTQPEASPAHHRLRVRFKTLRYTIEILGVSFPEEYNRPAIIPPLKRVQNALGCLNDADDLYHWLNRPTVKRRLDAAQFQTIRELALNLKQTRYVRAHEVVFRQAPPVLADLGRIAGRIGLL